MVSPFNGRRHWNMKGGVFDSKSQTLLNDWTELGIKWKKCNRNSNLMW